MDGETLIKFIAKERFLMNILNERVVAILVPSPEHVNTKQMPTACKFSIRLYYTILSHRSNYKLHSH